MPRIRPASRSGWKTSRASVFSPVPRNLTGTPVTAEIESAAPPRASPSILVRIRPVTGTAATNAWATATASWPVIASTTRSVSTGWTASLTAAISAISASSIDEPAGGVEDDHVADLAPGGLDAAAGDVDDRCPDRAPGGRGCRGCARASRAGRRRPGRYGSAATRSGRRPSLTTCRASLAVEVVLPEPWRPTIATTAGLPDRWKVRSPADRSATSSSLTILTTCWPADRLSSTSCPIARSRTRATKSLTTLKLTSASSSARRTSRMAASTSASLIRPRPVRLPSVLRSRSLRVSNMVRVGTPWMGDGPDAASGRCRVVREF